MLRFLAGALALALVIFGCHKPAHAAGIPLVTGRCGCAIGGGLFIAPCGSPRVTCTKAMCFAACQAAMPKKSSELRITDVSSARRLPRVRIPDRHAGVHRQRPRIHASRVASSHRSPARMDVARAPQADRDGRGYASAPAGLRAPVEMVTHRRARGLARAAIQGATIGGLARVCAGSSCGTVAGWAAEKFRGLFADLAALGYSLGHPGCYSRTGHMRNSLHHWGGACDLFNQVARNRTALRQPPPSVQIELAAKHGLTSGCAWRNPDCGHFDLSGVGMGRRYARNGAPRG